MGDFKLTKFYTYKQVIMFKNTFLAGFVLLILFVTFSCSPVREIPRAEGHVTENIQLEEASPEGFVNYPDSEVYIKVFHDYDSLGILLKTNDGGTATGFLANGLSIWIDSTGNRKKEYGVIFPSTTLSELREKVEHSTDTINEEDTIDVDRMDFRNLKELVEKRSAVIQRGDRAEFADKQHARIFIEEDELKYAIKIPFSYAGITDTEHLTISIGAVSERDQPQPDAATNRRPGTTGRPGDRRGHPARDTPRSREEQEERIRVKPINAWLLFEFNKEE